jgi:hypothetical protein
MMQPTIKRSSFSQILVALIITASLSGCAWLSPDVKSGEVLFQDNFSINTSGWDRYRDDLYEADYDQETYKILVFSPDTMVWSLPNLSYTDVILRVQAWRTAGPDNNLFGLVCRYENADNFIFFVLSTDGYVGIGEYNEGTRSLLTDESLLPFEGIRSGDNINLIEAKCIGDELSLSINGQSAAQAHTEKTIPGDVGLLAGTYDEAGVEIRYDNFSMLQP